jgi:hemerythrin-like domain-containing protein
MTAHSIQIIRDEHAAVAAVLRSLEMLTEQGPGDKPARFFEVLRSMLFYIDEFPERRHHPNESRVLFPMLMRGAPELRAVIERLEIDHDSGERKVRELQHLLSAWEIVGDSRRAMFEAALVEYVRFYLDHMRTEETQLLPVARRIFSAEDWKELDAAFETQRDPLAGGARDAEYEALFNRIVNTAPAPIGLGEE